MNVFANYEFPFKNPYTATILGSSKIMTEGVSEEVPTKKYSIILDENRYLLYLEDTPSLGVLSLK